MVRAAVSALVPVILTGLVEPKLKVGGYSAPFGLEVTDAVSVTLPVNPPLGAIVMVEASPVAAPGKIETADPATVNEGGTGGVTVTENVPDVLEKIAELCASGL
jgi:hypothetical protein